MSKTQAKLQSIIKQGNGIDSLSSVFGTEPAAPVNNGVDDDDMTDAPKKQSLDDIKVEPKKNRVGATKKHARVHMAGQTGAHNARLRISKSNKRGQTKRGFSITKKSQGGAKKKRSSSKKMSKF